MPNETAALAAATVEEQEGARDSEAEYMLEYPATCPHCTHTIKVVKVVRLLRTRVHFTSSLPRRGRALICPDCRSVLSGELTLT